MRTINQFYFGCPRRHIIRSEMALRGGNHSSDAFCYICGQFIKTRTKKFSVIASRIMVKFSYFEAKKSILKTAKAIFERNNEIFLLFCNEKCWKITLAYQRQKSCYVVLLSCCLWTENIRVEVASGSLWENIPSTFSNPKLRKPLLTPLVLFGIEASHTRVN